MESAGAEAVAHRSHPAAWGGQRRYRVGVRGRIFGWYVGLIVVAAIASLLLQRALLEENANRTLDEELIEEERDLRLRIDQGQDVVTGEPWPDLHSALESFVRRTVPEVGETFIAIVQGEVLHDTGQLASDPELRPVLLGGRQVADVRTGEVEAAKGRLRYRAVSLEHGGQRGSVVITIFTERETKPIADAMRIGATVWISIVAAASIGAWLLAGRVLRPVRDLTETARTITDTDLTRRIDAPGQDEIAELAATFNAMVDRLDVAFSTQRAFLDDAGHELRTPITIISGHLELMGDDPDERRETVALVTDELDRMTRLVDDLLLLAKAERPGFLQLEPLDLAAFTRELGAKVLGLAARDWEVASVGNGVILADRQRLTQAVMNLARNAVQHTDEGAPISLGSSTGDGRARIWVRDSGPGVPSADREGIFERFARGRAGQRRSEGAGLGLAISRAIVEAHHGRIELESHEGLGATFTIVLPMRKAS